jgi:hypothetical protein
MLHWAHKLSTVVLVALAVAGAMGKVSPFAFHW